MRNQFAGKRVDPACVNTSRFFTQYSYAAFTLIEILVATAIIGILVAVLFAVIDRGRSSANASQCLSNLRQLAIAMHLYTQDNNGCLPYSMEPAHGGSWDYLLRAYLFSQEEAKAAGKAKGLPTGIFRCPVSRKTVLDAERASSFAININLVKQNASRGDPQLMVNIAVPSQTYLIIDSNKREFWRDDKAAFVNDMRYEGAAVHRHNGKLNMAFADASVRALDFEQIAWDSASVTRAPWGPHQ